MQEQDGVRFAGRFGAWVLTSTFDEDSVLRHLIIVPDKPRNLPEIIFTAIWEYE